MSVALSGEITAIATAVLALFAIITAVLAYRALSKQAEDIHVIEQQAADQSKVLELQIRDLSESLDERRSEARRLEMVQVLQVFIWLEPHPYADGEEGRCGDCEWPAGTSP